MFLLRSKTSPRLALGSNESSPNRKLLKQLPLSIQRQPLGNHPHSGGKISRLHHTRIHTAPRHPDPSRRVQPRLGEASSGRKNSTSRLRQNLRQDHQQPLRLRSRDHLRPRGLEEAKNKRTGRTGPIKEKCKALNK